MAHSTSPIHEQSPAVEKKRSWSLMLLSAMIGAAVSLAAFFAIAALMEPGAVPSVVGITAAGVIWGVTTEVSNNLIGSEVSVTLQSHLIQQSYRRTIELHIGAALERVIMSIRTNTPFELHDRVHFSVYDKYRFLDKKRHMFFSFSFKVLPEPGTLPRPLNEGIPPLDLPTYDPSRTHTIEDRKDLSKGVFGGTRQRAILGFTSGLSASLMYLLLGTAGVVLGIVLATMLVNHFTTPKRPEDVALSIEFANELRRHLDRLLHCARQNNIGLEAHMWVASTSGMTRTWFGRSREEVKVMAEVHRSLSGRVLWARDMAGGEMPTRKTMQSIADGPDKGGACIV